MTHPEHDNRNLCEQVADRLERDIIGLYATGERLPSEQQLTETYQVSRTVIREAMKLLKERGLVDSRTGSGAYVMHPEAQHISDMLSRIIKLDNISFHDIYYFRSILEIAAVRRAVERVTEQEIDEMQEILNSLRTREMTVFERRDADFTFHLAIARASRSPLLVLMVEAMSNVFKDVIAVGIVTKDGISDAILRHQIILDALKKKEADYAAYTVYSHLHRSEQNVADYLEEHGQSFTFPIAARHEPCEDKS